MYEKIYPIKYLFQHVITISFEGFLKIWFLEKMVYRTAYSVNMTIWVRYLKDQRQNAEILETLTFSREAGVWIKNVWENLPNKIFVSTGDYNKFWRIFGDMISGENGVQDSVLCKYDNLSAIFEGPAPKCWNPWNT